MKRKEFLRKSSLAGLSLGITEKLLASAGEAADMVSGKMPPPVCVLVPAETIGPFPSLPSGDAMYWRSDIRDGQAGVIHTFTIRINGTNNCAPMPGLRVDVWHCNAHGFYSHYASGGSNNGHNGQNTPVNNATLIYCRGNQITNANGEVTFTSIFPGWYPGRTCHIHFAIYAYGTPGTSSGWIQQRISQFTFPISQKNALLVSQSPYSLYGADPTSPDADNVFSSPSGAWQTLQLATLTGSGPGPYNSYYECAITGTGALPLELIGFDGSVYGQSCLLRWCTASESNMSHYDLEYSPEGEDFEFLARIESKGNGLPGNHNYVFEDKDRLISGNAFYRLKMIDMDGNFNYSSIVVLHNHFGLPIRIFPVPADDHIILTHPLTAGGEKVMIVDGVGRAVAVGNLPFNTSLTNLPLTLCKSGVYYLIYSSEGRTQTIKFVKR